VHVEAVAKLGWEHADGREPGEPADGAQATLQACPSSRGIGERISRRMTWLDPAAESGRYWR
jgi:hypothetical protein